MHIINTGFEGLLIIEPTVHRDERGFFLESFREDFFQAQGINFKCLQSNQAMSTEKGVLRGLHFQAPPKAQAKLVWVSAGEVLDVVVDLRQNSSTYGKHYSVHLSATNFRRLFIPKGFAHGYFTLTPNSEFNYIVDEYYSPKHEGGILWNDPYLNISWPLHAPKQAPKQAPKHPLVEVTSDTTPIISAKDEKWPRLNELNNPF